MNCFMGHAADDTKAKGDSNGILYINDTPVGAAPGAAVAAGYDIMFFNGTLYPTPKNPSLDAIALVTAGQSVQIDRFINGFLNLHPGLSPPQMAAGGQAREFARDLAAVSLVHYEECDLLGHMPRVNTLLRQHLVAAKLATTLNAHTVLVAWGKLIRDHWTLSNSLMTRCTNVGQLDQLSLQLAALTNQSLASTAILQRGQSQAAALLEKVNANVSALHGRITELAASCARPLRATSLMELPLLSEAQRAAPMQQAVVSSFDLLSSSAAANFDPVSLLAAGASAVSQMPAPNDVLASGASALSADGALQPSPVILYHAGADAVPTLAKVSICAMYIDIASGVKTVAPYESGDKSRIHLLVRLLDAVASPSEKIAVYSRSNRNEHTILQIADSLQLRLAARLIHFYSTSTTVSVADRNPPDAVVLVRMKKKSFTPASLESWVKDLRKKNFLLIDSLFESISEIRVEELMNTTASILARNTLLNSGGSSVGASAGVIGSSSAPAADSSSAVALDADSISSAAPAGAGSAVLAGVASAVVGLIGGWAHILSRPSSSSSASVLAQQPPRPPSAAAVAGSAACGGLAASSVSVLAQQPSRPPSAAAVAGSAAGGGLVAGSARGPKRRRPDDDDN